VSGTRSKIKVSSMLFLLSILLSILSPSSVGRGLTVGAGRGSYEGAESYTESNVVARWAAGPLEFASNLLI
jgi:hypothetical protein